MSVVRSSLDALMGVLADSVAPVPVGIDDGGTPSTDPVVVRVIGLDRIGRSRRDGPVLDLELSAAVRCTGPKCLEHVEQMLRAVETQTHFDTATLPVTTPAESGIGFLVRVPVTLRLSEPEGPSISTPLEIHTVIGRSLEGVLVGADGSGIGGARIRSSASAVSTSTDSAGHFEVLSTHDPVQEFTVEFRGQTQHVTVPDDPIPLTLHWN